MTTVLEVYSQAVGFQDLPVAIVCFAGLLLLFLGLAILVSVWSRVYATSPRRQQEIDVVDAEYEVIDQNGEDDGQG